MVVKPVDAVDEEEMEMARQRADRVVRQRYAENAAREDAIEAAEAFVGERRGAVRPECSPVEDLGHPAADGADAVHHGV